MPRPDVERSQRLLYKWRQSIEEKIDRLKKKRVITEVKYGKKKYEIFKEMLKNRYDVDDRQKRHYNNTKCRRKFSNLETIFMALEQKGNDPKYWIGDKRATTHTTISDKGMVNLKNPEENSAGI